MLQLCLKLWLVSVSVQLYFYRFSHTKIRPDQLALPTIQGHTAMASEAVTMKTLGTISLMYDKDDINYTVCFTVLVAYYLGLVV